MILNKILYFLFYLTDNIVWLANVGVLRRNQATKERWNNNSLIICLIKNVTGLLISLFQSLMYYKQAYDILTYFDEEDVKHILISEENEEIHKLVRSLIHVRRKLRYSMLNVTLSTLRLLMLFHTL